MDQLQTILAGGRVPGTTKQQRRQIRAAYREMNPLKCPKLGVVRELWCKIAKTKRCRRCYPDIYR